MSMTVTFDPRVAYLIAGFVALVIVTYTLTWSEQKVSWLQALTWLAFWPVLTVAVVFMMERERRRLRWLKEQKATRFSPTPGPEDLLGPMKGQKH